MMRSLTDLCTEVPLSGEAFTYCHTEMLLNDYLDLEKSLIVSEYESLN